MSKHSKRKNGRGGPRDNAGRPRTLIELRLPPEVYQYLEALAVRHGVGVVSLVKAAIREKYDAPWPEGEEESPEG